MILVIGGAYQGKLRLVLSWLGYAGADAGTDGTRLIWADGSRDGFEEIGRRPVICGVQKYLARCQAGEADADEWLERLLEADPAYVIMDEIGSGVVPIEPEQRELRELTGLAGQRLAKKAEAVYRVVCGRAVRIK